MKPKAKCKHATLYSKVRTAEQAGGARLTFPPRSLVGHGAVSFLLDDILSKEKKSPTFSIISLNFSTHLYTIQNQFPKLHAEPQE